MLETAMKKEEEDLKKAKEATDKKSKENQELDGKLKAELKQE